MKVILTIITLIFCLTACNDQTTQKKPFKGNTTTDNAHLPASKLSWEAPSDWQKTEPGQFITERYSLTKADGDSEDAQVTISTAGGSVEANVARWVGQMTQPDGRDTQEVTTLTNEKINELDHTIVSIPGTMRPSPMSGSKEEKPNYLMVAHIIKVSDGTYWFIKMTGPKNTVEKWKSSFTTFVNSIKEGK